MSSNRLILFSRLPKSGAGSSLCGLTSYGVTVLYPALSVVISQETRPPSSRIHAELFGPSGYCSAAARPFTFSTCFCGGW